MGQPARTADGRGRPPDAPAGRRLMAGSVARITDFDANPPSFEPLPREEWARGDYVVGEVLETGELPCRVETVTGRIARIAPGDLALGALGNRAATLEAVGNWEGIGEDGVMQQLSAACVFGRCTSLSQWTHPLADLRYRGHAVRDGRKLTMRGFVTAPERDLAAPVVLIVGTSMDAGKTVAGMEIIRSLKRRGLRVAGAKLTGVGRLQDILAFEDAGADYVTDFMGVGLPGTVVPRADYEQALRDLLATVAATEPDVLVAEAGASPLEPYNGETVLRVLAPRLGMLVVCASDPYAVAGVVDAFDRRPDLVGPRRQHRRRNRAGGEAHRALGAQLPGTRLAGTARPDALRVPRARALNNHRVDEEASPRRERPGRPLVPPRRASGVELGQPMEHKEQRPAVYPRPPEE